MSTCTVVTLANVNQAQSAQHPWRHHTNVNEPQLCGPSLYAHRCGCVCGYVSREVD